MIVGYRAMLRALLGGTALGLGVTPVFAAPDAPLVVATASVARQDSIHGRVSDPSGSALPGARVSIPSTGVETTTDLQGEFVLPVPDGGTVMIQVEYLGRPALTVTVDAAERGTNLAIVLPGSDQTDGEVVVVGSIRDNTARALNQQRQSDNTTTVLSSDAIGRFPDPNIAEALQRVAGVGIERDQGEGRYVNVRGAPAEFSAVTIDGVRVSSVDPTTRAVDLDTIPSDVVANLEVAKSLLPNQEADSIAGAINISTKSPFDARGFRLTGSGGLGYNQFGGTDRRGTGSVSTLFGGDRQFGVLVSGSYSVTERRPDNVENAWAVIPRAAAAGGPFFGVTETLFKDYDTRRERIAGTASLEWRPAAGSRLYLRGSYSRFEDDEFRNRLGILWTEGTLQPGATDTTATYTNTRIEKQVRHRIQRNEIATVTAGGDHRVGGGRVEYDASYSRSEQTYPRRDELLYRSSLRPRQSYDFGTDADLPSYSLFTTNEHLQEGTYAFRENAFRSNSTLNDEYSGGVKVEAPLASGRFPVTLTVGGRYRERTVTADEERLRDRTAGAAPAGTFADQLSDQASRNFAYDLGRKFLTDRADAYYDARRASSMRRIPQSLTADYVAAEKVFGMFGMLRASIDRTTVIAGLRVEATRFRGEAPTYNETTAAIGTARATSDYLDFFPNLTLRHAFTPDLIGRLAISRAINRPNFLELVPRVLDNTDSATPRVTAGNPDLRPTLSDNVDAGLEYYLKPLGLLSVNAFYKALDDYRYTVTRNGTYLGAPAVLTRPENAPNGKLYGVEFNWQQQFTFLPGPLAGFGVFANYTLARADVRLAAPYAGRSRLPLPGQSRNTWNISGFYERGPVNLRLSYTKRSDYLDEVNADVPALDLYWEGRGQLDATGSIQLNKAVGVFVEAKNLTNSPGVRYFGTRERVYEYEKFGYTIFGGVKVKL